MESAGTCWGSGFLFTRVYRAFEEETVVEFELDGWYY